MDIAPMDKVLETLEALVDIDKIGAEPVIQSFEFTFKNGNIFEGAAR